ncbi:MAG: hypothetical protein ABI912_06960 [Actinomycetota bacterium]
MATVLVTDASPAESAVLMTELARVGHEIVRCFPLASVNAPCAYIATGVCPVDDKAIDLAVDVRTMTAGALTPREQGAVCALRAGIPVIIATDSDNPLFRLTTTTMAEDAATAVEVALTQPSIQSATRRVGEAAVRELGLFDPAVKVSVDIVLRDSTLDLVIAIGSRPPAAVMQAVRSAATRAARDHWPPFHVGSVIYALARSRTAEMVDVKD